ncbi:hypothetical protein ECZU24_59830 [Escherichia coli]|nr:hypothetical protein ECZU24_59830 [Escherichia coli]
MTVRPFYLLEGATFLTSGAASVRSMVNGNGDNVGKLLEGEYFTVRGYQKGTVHIVFKRSDLVEKLNDIIARYYPRCIAATSLIKQKSHDLCRGFFFL